MLFYGGLMVLVLSAAYGMVREFRNLESVQ